LDAKNNPQGVVIASDFTVSGDGDAELEENGTLNGEIRFDNGDESSFTAKRW
jgi:hypothetical protein